MLTMFPKFCPASFQPLGRQLRGRAVTSQPPGLLCLAPLPLRSPSSQHASLLSPPSTAWAWPTPPLGWNAPRPSPRPRQGRSPPNLQVVLWVKLTSLWRPCLGLHLRSVPPALLLEPPVDSPLYNVSQWQLLNY